MDSETHDFSFSIDQPETMLQPLLALLQPENGQNRTGTSRSGYLLETQSILIIDNDRVSANTVAQCLNVETIRKWVLVMLLSSFRQINVSNML